MGVRGEAGRLMHLLTNTCLVCLSDLLSKGGRIKFVHVCIPKSMPICLHLYLHLYFEKVRDRGKQAQFSELKHFTDEAMY